MGKDFEIETENVETDEAFEQLFEDGKPFVVTDFEHETDGSESWKPEPTPVVEPETTQDLTLETPLQVDMPLVHSEHLLDSDVPALAEEDEIVGSGWNKRVVVITGAASGIGLATARKFSLYADVVYNLSRERQDDDNINWIKVDVTRSSDVRTAFEKIFEKEGQIDVLINCAGIGFSGSVEGADTEDIAHVFNVNIVGTATCCSAVIPYMRATGRGRIINIASMAGAFPLPFQSFYSASKAAVINFTNALRTEVAPLGIKTSCVLFSEIKTPFTENRIKNREDNRAYKYRLAKSVAKYEFAEQLGQEPEWVAARLFKLSNAKNPKSTVIFGLKNKWRLFLKRFLCDSTINRMISRKY